MNAEKAGSDAQETANSTLSSSNSNATAITAIAIVLGFNTVGLLLTAVGAGAGYVSLGVTVTALSATVARHTAEIIAINRITRYMRTSTLLETDYTRFKSDIIIHDIANSHLLSIFLSMKDNNVNFNGTITNTELNNNTSNITTISNTIRHMSSNTQFESDYTQFLSDIKICDSLDPDYIPNVYLSSSVISSFFNNSVHFYKNISIDGTISNAELNNNTSNIISISGLVNTHTNNLISSISGFVNTISGNIISISGLVNTHTNYINNISGSVNSISGNVQTISGYVNTISSNIADIYQSMELSDSIIHNHSLSLESLSGKVTNNNLNNAILVTGSALTGYTINIGDALSKYI